jgi:hypothetical protein
VLKESETTYETEFVATQIIELDMPYMDILRNKAHKIIQFKLFRKDVQI